MVAMPHRQYSAAIIGESWPVTDPSIWQQAAMGLLNKSHELGQDSTEVFKTAWNLPAANNSGKAVDAFIESAGQSSKLLSEQAKLYSDLAEAAQSTSELLDHLRTELCKPSAELLA